LTQILGRPCEFSGSGAAAFDGFARGSAIIDFCEDNYTHHG
jgi:hypothetical protein